MGSDRKAAPTEGEMVRLEGRDTRDGGGMARGSERREGGQEGGTESRGEIDEIDGERGQRR
jgi:hypothetical protein